MQLDLRPALGTTTQWGRAHDARAMLVGDDPHAWLHLDDDEVAVVRLMTGRHTVAELHTLALALDQPVVPDRVNDLLRRLERARLLATEVDASTGLYSAVRATSARRSAWTVPVGARMQRLLSLVPSALVRPLTTLVAMGLAGLVLFAFARGQAGALFSPWRADASVASSALGWWLGAGLALSMRSIARALALAAHGHPVTAVGIQRTAFVVHVTGDLRARRGAPPRARMDVAFAGLAGLGLTALAAGTAALTTDAATASAISAAAWLAFALDLAPWLRTDTRDLLGIWTRVPGLGRGAVRYISSAITQRGAVTAHERALGLAAVVGVVHTVLVVALVAGGGLPGLVQRSIRVVYAPALADGGTFERGLTLGLTAIVTGAVILLVVGMTRELSRVVRAVVRPRPSAAVGTATDLTADQRASIAATEPITFVLRALEPDVRHGVLAAFEARAFTVGDCVTVQGDPIRRAGVVLSGALDRSRRTVTGDDESLGVDREGDSFGFTAFDADVSHTETRRAQTRTIVATADLEAMLAAVPADERDDLVARARAAHALIRLPHFAHLPGSRIVALLAAARRVTIGAGETVTVDEAYARTLWVVVAGRVRRVPTHGGPGDVLEAGACAGAFSPEGNGLVGHHLVADIETHLVRIPFEPARRALLTGAAQIVRSGLRKARSTAAVAAVGATPTRSTTSDAPQ